MPVNRCSDPYVHLSMRSLVSRLGFIRFNGSNEWSTSTCKVGVVLGYFNTGISTIHDAGLGKMSIRMTGFTTALLVRLLTVLATIALLAMPHIAKKLVEKFSASDFATAVIAQNKEVFDRLAEM